MTPAPWRVGRKLGRTLYEEKYTDRASDDDRFVGIMDTPEDAQRVVDAVNAMPIIWELHQPFLVPLPDSPMDLCRTCQQIHPCATLRALGGDDA